MENFEINEAKAILLKRALIIYCDETEGFPFPEEEELARERALQLIGELDLYMDRVSKRVYTDEPVNHFLYVTDDDIFLIHDTLRALFRDLDDYKCFIDDEKDEIVRQYYDEVLSEQIQREFGKVMNRLKKKNTL